MVRDCVVSKSLSNLLKKKKRDAYKTDHKFYVILLLISLLIVVLIGIAPVDAKWFSILTGVSSGAIASIIIAWVLDVNSCIKRNQLNQTMLDQLLEWFDMGVLNEMSTILYEVATRNNVFDIDRSYSIDEIIEIVKNEDGNLPDWKMHCGNLGTDFSSIDISRLVSYDPTEQHLRLYRELQQAQRMHATYSYITSKATVTPQDSGAGSFEYLIVQGDLDSIKRIYQIRDKQIRFEVVGYYKNITYRKREEDRNVQ